VQRRPGTQHGNADSLSRRVATARTQPTTQHDRIDWPQAQQVDPVIGEIYRLVQAGSARPNPEPLPTAAKM